MHAAVIDGATECVRVLVEKGKADLISIDGATLSPLHSAMFGVLNGRIIDLLLKCPSVANFINLSLGGYTPLHIAIEKNFSIAVTKLLNAGADVNARHYCRISGASRGDEPKHRSIPPIIQAAEGGHVFVVHDLMNHPGIDMTASCSETGMGVLGCVLTRQPLNMHRIVHKLSERFKGLLCNHEDHTGSTPLFVAAAGGFLELTKQLLLSEANPCHSNRNGLTPLHMAICCKEEHICEKIVECLINNNADVNGGGSCNNEPLSPVYVAASPSAIGSAKKQRIGESAAMICDGDGGGAGGGSEVVENVKEANSSSLSFFVEKKKQPPSPLQMALTKADGVSGNYKKVVGILLEKKADVNVIDAHGSSTVHLAVLSRFYDALPLLISAGANINSRRVGGDGATALHISAMEPFTFSLTSMLLNMKADPTLRDNNGKTCLHWIASSQNMSKSLVANMLQAKACLSVKDHQGLTPLQVAEMTLRNASSGGETQLEVQDRMVEVVAQMGSFMNHDRFHSITKKNDRHTVVRCACGLKTCVANGYDDGREYGGDGAANSGGDGLKRKADPNETEDDEEQDDGSM